MGKLTQEEFERLPGLVPRAVFLAWTGLSAPELYDEVKVGRIKVYQPGEGKYRKYYKVEIARIAGFKL